MTAKQKQFEAINALLEQYRVLDSTIHLDPHEYGIWERQVRDALIALEKLNLPLDALFALQRLLDGVLAQALNRDPSLPSYKGMRACSEGVGKVKASS